MNKFFILFLGIVSVVALAFSSCSSEGDDEPSVSGNLVSSIVPSDKGWSGNLTNGICTYLPENVDAEVADVYYAFSFSEGVCTEAVFNVVCPSEAEAGYMASMLNSGAWAEDEDEEDYYALSKTESPLTQQMFRQALSARQTLSRNYATLSRAASMAIPCTQQGKVVFFKLEAFKGCNAEDVKVVMKVWDTGLDVNSLPSHCVFGEWNASTGKYTANNVYGFLNTKYEIATNFEGEFLDEFATTLTMPNIEWAVIIEESWLEQVYEYEQMFGEAPEVTRSENKVTMKALILDKINKEQTLQIIIMLDILNHMPFYISMF